MIRRLFIFIWFLLAALAPYYAKSFTAQEIALGNPKPSYECSYYNGSFCGGETFTRASSATNLFPNSTSGASFTTFGSGVPRFGAGGIYCCELAVTNYLLNSGAPVTQTTGSLPNATYTLWVNGAGTATMSAGTATGCGTGVASQGTWISFTTSGTAGTCTVTVSGALNEFQLENSAFPSSYVPTTGATASRVQELLSFKGGNALAPFLQRSFSVIMEVTGPTTVGTLTGQRMLGTSGTAIMYAANNNSIDAYNGTTLNCNSCVTPTFVSGSPTRIGVAGNIAGRVVFGIGGGVRDANPIVSSITAVYLGSNGTGTTSSWGGGWIGIIAVYPFPMSGNLLQAKLRLGAPL